MKTDVKYAGIGNVCRNDKGSTRLRYEPIRHTKRRLSGMIRYRCHHGNWVQIHSSQPMTSIHNVLFVSSCLATEDQNIYQKLLLHCTLKALCTTCFIITVKYKCTKRFNKTFIACTTNVRSSGSEHYIGDYKSEGQIFLVFSINKHNAIHVF